MLKTSHNSGQGNRILLTIATCAALLLVSTLGGCGYSAVTHPPVDMVKIGRIENNTTEPGLQDKLFETLSLELVRNGIAIDPSAMYTIVGSLENLTVRNLVTKDSLTVQFEILIEGKFFMKKPSGEKRPLRSKNVFIVTFVRLGALEGVISEREQAIDLALKDLASELSASIIYKK